MYLFALVLWLNFRMSSGYPTGAPSTVCESMMPGHNVAPQGLPQNINIFEISSQTYSPNSPITVKVKGTMVGLLLQARKNSDMLPVGSFSSLPAGTKALTCQGMSNSVTHSAKTPNTDPTFTWNPPASDVGDVTFYLTMVRDYGTFWVKIPSPVVKYAAMSNPQQIAPPASPTTTTTMVPESEPENNPPANNAPNSFAENSGNGVSSPITVLTTLFLFYNIKTLFL